MEWVEASGKTLPEVKEIVLDLLGVAEDDAEIVVLNEPKPGLFGRMRGEARVQARVRPVTPPPKRGRSRRPERGKGGDRSRGGSSGPKSSGSGSGGRNQESPGGGRPEAGRSDQGRGGAKAPKPRQGEKREVRNQRTKEAPGPRSGESEDEMQESLTLEEQGAAGKDFLSGLVREFGLSAEVAVVEVDEETVQIAATGNDLGLLVGPKGSTLAAVQDLTRTFVQRQSEARTDRILVDVGGYREKRSAALRRFTEAIVDEVKESGEDRSLEPMSPADRKVVHDTVNAIDGVETRSAGEEPSRYVVVQPSD